MERDQTTDRLLAELRHFRRQGEPFSAARLSAEQLLAEYLGNGDLEQGFASLLVLVHEYETQPDSDIHVFFLTCGWQTPGDNLDERLRSTAKSRHSHERTILRASDRGAEKLAEILRYGRATTRPFVEIFVREHEGKMRSRLDFVLHPGSRYRDPSVKVNGIRLGHLVISTKEDHINPGFERSSHSLPDQEIRPPSVDPDAAFSLHICWAIPIWPDWALSARLFDTRLFPQLRVYASSTADVDVLWDDAYL